MSEQKWRDWASCKDQPGPWDHDAHPDQQREAITACLDCPVFDACANYARQTRPDGGVWAGRVYEDRKPRKDIPCGTCGAEFTTPLQLAGHVRSHSTTCRKGLHDLSQPDALYTAGGRRECRKCRESRERRRGNRAA